MSSSAYEDYSQFKGLGFLFWVLVLVWGFFCLFGCFLFFQQPVEYFLRQFTVLFINSAKHFGNVFVQVQIQNVTILPVVFSLTLHNIIAVTLWFMFRILCLQWIGMQKMRKLIIYFYIMTAQVLDRELFGVEKSGYNKYKCCM